MNFAVVLVGTHRFQPMDQVKNIKYLQIMQFKLFYLLACLAQVRHRQTNIGRPGSAVAAFK